MQPTIKIALGLGTAGFALCACAAVLGIDDGHLREDGDGQDATTDGNGPSIDGPIGTGDTSVDGQGDAGKDTGPPGVIVGDGSVLVGESGTAADGCEDITIDDGQGIFVTTDGTDGPSCGDRSTPCKTVQHGIDRVGALRPAKTTVFVAGGTYPEALTLANGVTVIGGFAVLTNAGAPPTWTRQCSNAVTIIKPPAGTTITVRADRIGGPSKLSTVSIESEDAKDVKSSESIFGVVATGQNTAVTLVAVSISTANAGDGTAGAPGDAGATGRDDCDSGGDAAPGAPPGKSGDSADSGYFTTTGYVATGGTQGAAGPAGMNGTAAGPGTCVHCITCSGLLIGCASDAGLGCGTDGTVGCGGPGGSGGSGGTGGGSSVPVLAWDGAQVSVTAGRLTAGSGGRGGAGGGGGGGGSGGTGKAGATTPTVCTLTCTATCGTASSGAGQGGAAGGKGGAGATGGSGGDGSGGDSFSYVVGPDAVVTFGATKPDLAHGSGGTAIGNGSGGRAGDKGP